MKGKIANYVFGIVALLLVIAGTIGIAMSQNHNDNPVVLPASQVLLEQNPSKLPDPVDLTGVWVQTDGTQAENMTAQISHGEIQIELQLNTRTATYWDGSFDYDQVRPGSTSFDVVSQSSHPFSIFASTLDAKKFSYKNGVLSYDFKIVGTDRIIQLRKGGA